MTVTTFWSSSIVSIAAGIANSVKARLFLQAEAKKIDDLNMEAD